MAVPDAFSVIVWFAPPLMLYVTVAFGVPVKVKDPEVLKQTEAVVVEIATVGKANTFTVAEPVCDWLQLGVVAEDTLTKS